MKRFLLSIRNYFRLIAVDVMLCGIILPGAVSVRAQGPIDIGVATGAAGGAEVIAIPEFGLSREASGQTITDLIYRNLELQGYFKRPANKGFVEEAHKLDLRAGSINTAEWRRLKAKFVVKGSLSAAASGGLIGELHVYDTDDGRRVFGMKYENARTERAMAQMMADDIVFRLTGRKGLARTQFVYVAIVGSGIKEIQLMDFDGGADRQLTRDGSLAATPAWGLNGTEIYFTSYRDKNPDLCGIFLDGSKSWYISRAPTLNLSPHWSPTRQRLLVTLGKDGNSEVYSMDRNGKDARRLTFDRAIDSSPSWSPNGQQICFTSNRSGNPQILIMDSDGQSPRQLTRSGTYNDGPMWSPQGGTIVFSGRRDGIFDIYAIESDGSNLRRLTSGMGNSEDPCWSPDGSHIVFSSDRTGLPQVWIMGADGSNQQRLTNQKRGAHSPAWGPFAAQ